VSTAGLDTYAELRLAEGKLLRWGERAEKAQCALQPRDLEILTALARYRFLTTGQIAELWWSGKGLRAVRRRMAALFDAGLVERFRPQTIRGAYQWTYCLARDGFRAAGQTGDLPEDLKFAPRREQIFDYRYVIHDLLVNEWVLRYRELIGEDLLDWAGPDESLIRPPKGIKVTNLGDYRHDVSGIASDAIRPVQPDARLDVDDERGAITILVEYDRTRRVDKNFDKFIRYEAFLAGWWDRVMPPDSRRPAVLFVCQDDDHRRRFVEAADYELTGYETEWAKLGAPREYPARDRLLFAVDSEIRDGDATAWRLPKQPPGSSDGKRFLRRTPLPGSRAES
jgi:hypothetical protein